MITCHKCSLCKKMVHMLYVTLVDPLNLEELVCFKCSFHCEEGETGPATNGGEKQGINGNTIGSVDTVKVPPKNNESTTIESSVNISHPSMTTVVSKTSTTKVRSSKCKCPEKVDPTTKKPRPEGQFFNVYNVLKLLAVALVILIFALVSIKKLGSAYKWDYSQTGCAKK